MKEKDSSHGNAEGATSSNSSEQLIELVPIENTPFTAVKTDDRWMLTMGKYKLSEGFHSLEECKEDAKDATWDRICKVMMIVCHDQITEQLKSNNN